MGVLLKPDYITSAFPAFLERNGFERMRFHDLRNTCASMKIANGDELLDVQQWLGHSTYETTVNLYIHLTYENKVKSSKNMASVTQRVFAQDPATDDEQYVADGEQVVHAEIGLQEKAVS